MAGGARRDPEGAVTCCNAEQSTDQHLVTDITSTLAFLFPSPFLHYLTSTTSTPQRRGHWTEPSTKCRGRDECCHWLPHSDTCLYWFHPSTFWGGNRQGRHLGFGCYRRVLDALITSSSKVPALPQHLSLQLPWLTVRRS